MTRQILLPPQRGLWLRVHVLLGLVAVPAPGGIRFSATPSSLYIFLPFLLLSFCSHRFHTPPPLWSNARRAVPIQLARRRKATRHTRRQASTQPPKRRWTWRMSGSGICRYQTRRDAYEARGRLTNTTATFRRAPHRRARYREGSKSLPVWRMMGILRTPRPPRPANNAQSENA